MAASRAETGVTAVMRAVCIADFGGAEMCVPADIATPLPGPGEVLIELAYAGVNFIDIYMRNGAYAKLATYPTPLPMTLGMEGAGTVVACGADVRDLEPGDRVAYAPFRGSYARYATVPAWRVVRVPAGIGLDVACALMLQGSTAHYLTHSAFALGPGDTCLVHAAAGGVGQLLVQLAKVRGATVIATVGNAEKAAIAKARGADRVILYREVDFQPVVRELTAGRGVDVVYDSVGKDTLARSLRSLRKRGTCILYGGSSGIVDSVDPLDLAEAGSVFFTRPHLADYIATREEVEMRAGDLFRAVAAGSLAVTIDRVFPLDAAAEAHRVLEGGNSRGKLLLRV